MTMHARNTLKIFLYNIFHGILCHFTSPYTSHICLTFFLEEIKCALEKDFGNLNNVRKFKLEIWTEVHFEIVFDKIGSFFSPKKPKHVHTSAHNHKTSIFDGEFKWSTNNSSSSNRNKQRCVQIITKHKM